MLNKFYIFDTDYAMFGIVTKNNNVVIAPPIAKWTIGKNSEVVKKYYIKNKNAYVWEYEYEENN